MTADLICDNGRIPEGYDKHPETLMTNFDGSINEAVACELKIKPLCGQYSGWNFCAYVWWAGSQWACEVWVYRAYRETIRAATLEEIMRAVSERYGYE